MDRNEIQLSQKFENKNAYICILSSLAGLLGFVNPALSIYLVYNAVRSFNILPLLPVIFSMGAVSGTRIYLRITLSNNLKEHERTPFVWLRKRIGKWLWWLEPLMGSWGFIGMVVKKISGKKGVKAQAENFLAFLLTDVATTFTAGVIYYLTANYIYHFCP
jgi:hypothetical protein